MKQAVRRALLRPGRVLRLPVGLGAGLRLEVVENGSIHTYLGTAELEIAPHVRRLVQPGTVCFDIGSHDGYYGMALGRLTEAPVWCFDADPAAVERTRRNVDRNGLGGRVRVVEGYVGDRNDPGRGMVTLDDLDGVPAPGLLKIDVDGGETAVLAGASRLLRETKPDVILETHSPDLERDCAELLLAAGYRVRIVTQRARFRQNRPAAHNRWLVARP